MATMALMAEPVRGGDETVAQDVGRTVGVPNPTPTHAVELAWSGNTGADIQDDDGDIHSEPAAVRQSWRATWRIAAALVAAGLVLAGAIVVGHWVLTGKKSPTKAAAPAPATTAPATAASAGAPTTIASTHDQDNSYIQALNNKGISFANPEAAVHNGKTVCQNIGQGMTVQQVVAEFRTSSPAFSDNANDFVAISIHAYCPQNDRLVPKS
jgi:hypothetical protein